MMIHREKDQWLLLTSADFWRVGSIGPMTGAYLCFRTVWATVEVQKGHSLFLRRQHLIWR